jgi:hypothetical protein
MPGWPNEHAALDWRKSSASTGGGECVEVACQGISVLVRDSSSPAMVLAFPTSQWSAFVRRVARDSDGSAVA